MMCIKGYAWHGATLNYRKPLGRIVRISNACKWLDMVRLL